MKVIAAYLLAVLGGNTSPSAEDINNILGSVGADDDMIELLLSQVDGKDVTELIADGREKLASVSSACGVSVAVAATGPTEAGPAADAEPNMEEKAENEEEEDDMCFSVFA